MFVRVYRPNSEEWTDGCSDTCIIRLDNEGLVRDIEWHPPLMVKATKRVRAAVAISETGEYLVTGWRGARQSTNGEMRATALREFKVYDLDGTPTIHFIEADVPLPVAPEGKQ